MKITLVLLQLLQLAYFSLQTCLYLSDSETTSVIDKWWTDGENVNVYHGGYTCYNIVSEMSSSVKELHGQPNRYYGNSDNHAFILKTSNIKILTLFMNYRCYEGINLENNFIESIEGNVFSSCSYLKEMNLRHNNITSLPDRLFFSNGYLRVVDLSYNMIGSVGTTTFSSKSITYLNLKHNNLQSLDFTLPQNLVNLELSFNSIKYIAKDTFSNMMQLNTLKLNNNALRTLNVLFSYNLRTVDLSHNMITFVENSTFSSHNIYYLNLQYNNLQTVDFKLPNNVLHLELSFNSISYIAKEKFSELLQLKTLKLNNNALLALPIGLFNANNNLEELDLSYNNISTVGKTTLLLHQIKNLNLQNNKLQSVDFTCPISLNHLDLSSNVLTVLDGDSFSGMTQLETLKLNDNCLGEVPIDLLNSLDSLREINLQHNRLTSIPSGFFVSNSNLKEINLGDNNISIIEESEFVSQNFERLNLGGNKIKTLNFSLSESMEFLDLSFNAIDEIDENFFNETIHLCKLMLNNNFLKNIPSGLFKNLEKLEEINLEFNSLTVIPDGFFNSNHNLNVTLNLCSNEISLIGREAFSTHGISELFLQKNKLKNVNFKLPLSLVSLDLSYNSISFIANDSFHGLTSLLDLQLNNNLLQMLPAGCFQSLNNLETLNLSFNKITMTYGTFSGLTSLSVLKIANNSITNLPELILHNLKDLTSLDISNNLLTNLETVQLTKHLTKLHDLYLQGNRFQCHHLLEIITQFESSGVVVRKGDKLFESNVQGINCIDNKTEETTKNISISISAEEFQRFLKEAMISEGNSSKIDSNYLNLLKNMSDANEELQHTLQELSSNLFSGNTSSVKRLQRILEEINANLISNTSTVMLQHNLETINAQLKQFSEALKGDTTSEEQLQRILEQINANLVSGQMFNASEATLQHILENLNTEGETQTKMLKEIQELNTNQRETFNYSYTTAQLKFLLQDILKVTNASVLEKSEFLKAEPTDHFEDLLKKVESNNVNYVFQTVLLLGLFVTVALMLYIQYMKFKVINGKQHHASASLTEMSHLELE